MNRTLSTNLTEASASFEQISDSLEDLDALKKNINDVFLLTNGIMIAIMQAGFAFLESGSVRTKNVINILLKNFVDMFICCIFYWAIGFGLAYSNGNEYIGFTVLANVSGDRMAYWFFQFIFANTAATILSGAVAERCNTVAYFVYSAVISGITYPIVSRWVWFEDGWLTQLGYKDFAGSGPVHLFAGTSSFVAAYLMGPRTGRFSNGRYSNPLPGHSLPLVGVGAILLVVGFLAFNGSSLGHMTEKGDSAIIASVMSNTVMGGSGGSITILFASRFGLCGPRCWNFLFTVNAAVSGMVSICAGGDQFSMWSSFIVGLIGGFTYVGLRYLVIYLGVDDPLDASSVHFGGGLCGVLSAPLFRRGGIIYGINQQSLMGVLYNSIGAACIILWSFLTSFLMFGLLYQMNLLRVTEVEETTGLDIIKHHAIAYPPSAWSDEHFKQDNTLYADGNILDILNQNSDRKIKNVNEYDNHGMEDRRL